MAERDTARLIADARGMDEQALELLDEALQGAGDELLIAELHAVIAQERAMIQRLEVIRRQADAAAERPDKDRPAPTPYEGTPTMAGPPEDPLRPEEFSRAGGGRAAYEMDHRRAEGGREKKQAREPAGVTARRPPDSDAGAEPGSDAGASTGRNRGLGTGPGVGGRRHDE